VIAGILARVPTLFRWNARRRPAIAARPKIFREIVGRRGRAGNVNPLRLISANHLYVDALVARGPNLAARTPDFPAAGIPWPIFSSCFP
jgi:hypothetical protein